MINKNFSIIDIEVTEDNEIFQIAIININSSYEILGKYNYYIKPQNELSSFITSLTGITNDVVSDKPNFEFFSKEIYELIKNNILICHGVIQDYSILKNEFLKCNIDYKPDYLLDTVELFKIFFPTIRSYKLSDLYLEFFDDGKSIYFHQADYDVYATYLLFKKIIKKINNLPSKNLEKLKKHIKDYSTDLFLFLNLFKNDNISILKNQFIYKNLVYNKVKNVNFNNKIEKSIFVSSIKEEIYINMFLKKFENNVYILKESKNYLSLDFLEYFFKNLKINNTYYMLYFKLLVWITETKTGSFDELNIDKNEKNILLPLLNKKFSNKNNYYNRKALNNAIKSGFIVTNYQNLFKIVNSNIFLDYKLIFENEEILNFQIKNLNNTEFYYKNVVAELNIAINNKKNKKLIIIKENISAIISYFYEIFMYESLELYNESKKYILDDINLIIDDLNNIKVKLFKTKKFINLLKKIINENYGYYEFPVLNNFNTFTLKYSDIDRHKIIINKIFTLNYGYLKNFNNERKNITIKNYTANNLSENILKNKLYLFSNNKYKEIYYSNRDKKLNVRYKKYSSDILFSDFFSEALNIKNNYIVCYADKEILYFKNYLIYLFDEFISFEHLEV